jgi:hypothetical protein
MVFMDSDNRIALKMAPMFVILMFLEPYMSSEDIYSSVIVIYGVYGFG